MPSNISPELMALLQQQVYRPPTSGSGGGSGYNSAGSLRSNYLDPQGNSWWLEYGDRAGQDEGNAREYYLSNIFRDVDPSFKAGEHDRTGATQEIYDAYGQYLATGQIPPNTAFRDFVTMAAMMAGPFAAAIGGTAAGASAAAGSATAGSGTAAGLTGYDLAMADLAASSGAGFGGAGGAAATGGGLLAGGGEAAAGLTGYDLAMADLAASSGAGFGEAAAASGGLLGGAGETASLTGYDAAMADLASSSGAGFGDVAAASGGASELGYVNGSDLMSDQFVANGGYGAGGFGGTSGTYMSNLIDGTGSLGSRLLGGTGAATGSGVLGTGLTAGQVLGAATTLAGAASGAAGTEGQEGAAKTMDPRTAAYVFGADGDPGLMGHAQGLLNRQMAPGYMQGYEDMRTRGQGLLSNPIAGNGFAQFFGNRAGGQQGAQGTGGGLLGQGGGGQGGMSGGGVSFVPGANGSSGGLNFTNLFQRG